MRCSVSSPDETPRRELKIRVFLTNFEVFHLVMKHCVECLIYYVTYYDDSGDDDDDDDGGGSGGGGSDDDDDDDDDV